MNTVTIIQEIIKKIIKEDKKNMEALFTGHRDISKYIMDTKEMLDDIGTKLVKKTLERSPQDITDCVWGSKLSKDIL